MLRPRRDDNKPTTGGFAKFTRIFGLLMTLIYVALGIFVIFGGGNLNISEQIRYMLGGILILYGIVRFVRLYRSKTHNTNDRYEE